MALKNAEPDALPERCVLFLTDAYTGGPVATVPVGLRARYRIQPCATTTQGGSTYMSVTAVPPAPAPSPSPVPSPVQAPPLCEFMLGMLATDHVGYASWDLSPLKRRLRLELDAALLKTDGATLDIDSLTLRLGGPLATEIDALNPAQLGSDAFVRSYAADPASLFQLTAGTYPAVQAPSLVDWSLSPASFSNLPAVLVGEDGCETLLPSNVAVQRYKACQVSNIRELVRWVGRVGLSESVASSTSTTTSFWAAGPTPPAGTSFNNDTPVLVADLITYAIRWLPAGHGLGQILYSMPLAPCEQVNIAILDWSRADSASRQEQTGLTDSLTHDTLRDRGVGEVVDSSLREYQRGSSTMAGASVVGGAAGVVGGALSLGTSYSTSSGERNLTASTAQTLTDHFHQASASVRDLRSTVIVQSTQQVSQNIQTRTVRNHNHSHAMTLLYYEVLRHYRVAVEMVDVGPALLLQQAMNVFDDAAIFQYRRFLEAGLLIEELRPGFDAIERLVALSPPWEPPIPPVPPAPDPGDLQFELFDFQFKVPDNGQSGHMEVKGSLVKKDGTSIALHGASGSDLLAEPDNFSNLGYVVPGQGIPAGDAPTWGSLRYLRLDFAAIHQSDKHDVTVTIDAKATDVHGAPHPIFHDDNWTWVVAGGTITKLMVIPESPTPPPPPPPLTPLDRLTPDERSLRARLISHLDENQAYYWRQIWMAEDPNERRVRLRSTTINLAGNRAGLFDIIENRVVDVVGDQLVFPLEPSIVQWVRSEQLLRYGPALSEVLISLPTRGVFGEAKLGHCNASEVIDNTRFWDWQTSPCPEDAPAITGVSPQGLGAPTLPTPTALPTSNLSQAAPPAEPDPIGLRAALDVLKTPGIFNNMSGIQQLQGLLGSLSDAASKVAAAKQPPSPGGSNPTPTPTQTPPGSVPPTVPPPTTVPPGTVPPTQGPPVPVTPTPTPITPTPIGPVPPVPVPPPRYQGNALRRLNVQVTRDRSQELYCVAGVVVERLDSAGDTKEATLGGDVGHVGVDLPQDWKSVSVHVYNPRILPGPSAEPVVATPPAPWVANPVNAGTDQQAFVVFNYPSQTQKVEIQTSEEAMWKLMNNEKEVSGWNINLKLGTEILQELAGKIPGIGDAKKVWKFAPELSGGVSGSTETGSGSESGGTTGQKKTWTVSVQYVDFTVPPEVYINGKKQ